MQVKYLYIWDDIPVFNNISVIEIEGKIQDFFNNIQSSRCKYILISPFEYRQWADELKDKYFTNVITIGTRPSLLQLPRVTNRASIKVCRSFTSDGFTKSLEFYNGTDQSTIETWSHTYDEIHFIEDVIVTGSTLQFICETLELYHFQGKVIIHVFAANQNSINRLKASTNCDIVFDSKIKLEKVAIEESTLLCLYDLLFNKHGAKLYKEQTDLLRFFFFDKIDQLLELLEEIEKMVKHHGTNSKDGEDYEIT